MLLLDMPSPAFRLPHDEVVWFPPVKQQGYLQVCNSCLSVMQEGLGALVLKDDLHTILDYVCSPQTCSLLQLS